MTAPYPQPGLCSICGCTEANACPVVRRDGRTEGCYWWPGTNRTKCSACVRKVRDIPIESKLTEAFGAPSAFPPLPPPRDVIAEKLNDYSPAEDLSSAVQGDLFG